MIETFCPHILLHICFQRFQQTMIGRACVINWWAPLLTFNVHHFISRFTSDVVVWTTPREVEKVCQIFLANCPAIKIWWMVSGLGLGQQKHIVGSIPNLLRHSLVSSFFVRALHTRKENLKGIYLFQVYLFTIVWYLCSLTTSQEDHENFPQSVSFQIGWSVVPF